MESIIAKVLGLEIGGTNIKACILEEKLSFNDVVSQIMNNIAEIKEFKTGSNPRDTLKEISNWIASVEGISIEYIYISMFGPLNVTRGSENYGTILNTPKPGWKSFNVVKCLSELLNVDKNNIIVETDVNCAAFLEYTYGKHNVSSLAYITIGTGVGVGVVVNHKLVHGLQHPEGGHIRICVDDQDKFEGSCPLHKNCLEGMITNGAIKARKNLNSVHDCENIDDYDEIWNYISSYIAQLCINLLYLISLERIIIGGGIINREILMNKIHKKFVELNNDYIDNSILKSERIQEFIKRTDFKNNSGILSAFSLKYLSD